MNIRRKVTRLVLLLAFVLAPANVDAQVFWTDWTTAGTGTVSGSLSIYSQSIGVTYTGTYLDALTSGTDPWSWDLPAFEFDGVDSNPPGYEKIRLDDAATHTITFSTPVVDPYLAIMSQGRGGLPVTYAFSDAFTVLSAGPAYWGYTGYTTPDATTLVGREYSGVIQFSGTFESLTWRASPDEFWHGVTVGAAGSVVPEPATVLLLATGLLGLGVAARRRRKDEEEV